MVFLLLFSPSICFPQSIASRAALYTGVAADLASTELATRRGFTEANPILSDNRLQRVAVSVGLAVGVDLATRALARWHHEKMAARINWIVGGAHAGATVWNLRGR